MVACASETSATIGREEADLNFPEDIYMSGNHARVEQRTRYFGRLRAEGSEIVCVLESDVQASTYARMRHAYVEALRDLEAGRGTEADAHLREMHEIHRWSVFTIEDPDALLDRSTQLLAANDASGR